MAELYLSDRQKTTRDASDNALELGKDETGLSATHKTVRSLHPMATI